MNTTNLIKKIGYFFQPFCSEFYILIPAISNYVLCVYMETKQFLFFLNKRVKQLALTPKIY